MRSRKAVSVLCFGLAVCLLAANQAYANTPDTNSLPPAIGMLKNLKKNSSNTSVIKSVEKINNIKAPVVKTEPEPEKITVHKKVMAPKKVAIIKKPTVPKSKALKSLGKPLEDKPHGKMVEPESAIEEAKVDIKPEHIQFDQDALQKRQEEMEQDLAEAKAREEVKALEAAQYYAEHEHEIKLHEIGDALANRKPAFQPGAPEPKLDLAGTDSEASSATSNIYPVKSVKISLKPRHKSYSETVKPDVTKKPDVKKSKLSSVISRAARREPVKPATQASTTLESEADNYSPLPEGAKLVAGNPYNDEFFIVAEDSPTELKQLAAEATNKDYLPPVVVAASEKQSNDHAVRTLINKVTTTMANTAKYVSDPIIHYMTKTKIAAANHSSNASKPKKIELLSQPKFASEKIATKVFNSQLSQKQETEELNKLVNQLDIKRNQKHESKLLTAVSRIEANKKKIVKVAKVKKDEKSKAIASKVSHKGKDPVKEMVAAEKNMKKEAFKPTVKSYASMVKMKHYSKTAKPVTVANHKPDTDKPNTKRAHPDKKGIESYYAARDKEGSKRKVNKLDLMHKKSVTKLAVKPKASSMQAAVVRKPKPVVSPEDEDLMNAAY